MLRLSPSTALAISLHAADQSWVMFAQVRPPVGDGPVRVEGLKAQQLVPRMRALAAYNAYDVFLIGLLPTPAPVDVSAAIYQQFTDDHLHDGWFTPSAELGAFIDQHATETLNELLAQTHPAGLDDGAVDIDEMAALLGVAPVTVRRMIKANEIPYLRAGRALRFVPSDVFATLRQRR